MPEVEIKIRFVGSENKFPSQRLRWLLDILQLAKLRGEEIPEMEISTTDAYGNTYRTKVSPSLGSTSKLREAPLPR